MPGAPRAGHFFLRYDCSDTFSGPTSRRNHLLTGKPAAADAAPFQYPATLAVLVTLALLFCAPAPVPAGYFFDAAAAFGAGYRPVYLLAGDLDLDGITDLVVNNYYGNSVCVLPGRGDGTFQSAIFTGVGGNCFGGAIGDLDEDGIPDMVVNHDDYWGITILLGNGDGSFTSGEVYEPQGVNPANMVLGDLDGDGHLDLAVANIFSDDISIHLGPGDGTLEFAGNVATGDFPIGILLAHLDGDDLPDLLTANMHDNTVSVLLNAGSGSFAPQVVYDAGIYPYSIALGDLNGDGHPDLAVGHDQGDTVVILDGNGDGTFGGPREFPAGAYPNDVALGDLDGDGLLDLATTSRGAVPGSGNGVTVLRATGDGSFSEPLAPAAAGQAELVLLADLNRDGLLDAAVLNDLQRRVCVLLGRGDGTFRSAPDYEAGDEPLDTAQGDLDGDGLVDLAVAGGGGSEVSLLRGRGDGTFDQPDGVAAGPAPDLVRLADLERDGDLDLVVRSSAGQGLTTLTNDGAGGFTGLTTHDFGFRPNTVAARDVDGDRYPDLVLTNGGSAMVAVAINDGDGSFAGPLFYPGSGQPSTSVVADLDGDGDPDIAVDDRAGLVHILINDGTGAFTPGTAATAPLARGLAAGNLDGDPFPDLAVGRNQSDRISILLNNGDGTFRPAGEVLAGSEMTGMLARDLDADGFTDLLAASAGTEAVAILPGKGDGTFGETLHIPLKGAPSGLTVGDLNGDRAPDAVLAMSGHDTVTVLLNSTPLSSLIAAAPGPGHSNPPLIRLFRPGFPGEPLVEIAPYGAAGFGASMALGDLDADGSAELVTGPGPGPLYGPHVRGFRLDGSPIPGISFLAYGTSKWGVNVACGDTDGDTFDEIITGAGPGAVFGPHVRGWNWDGSGVAAAIPALSFLAYGTPKWGVNVACGDVDGDAIDEIITGAGPGAVYGPHVRGWNVDGAGPASAITGLSFLAYGTHKWGVNVACGDIDGDGMDEIVTGAGPGAVFAAHVRGWNLDGATGVSAIPGMNFLAYSGLAWGVNVACGDLDGDGTAEIFTGPGPGVDHPPLVAGWTYDGVSVNGAGALMFLAFDPAGFTHGVRVSSMPGRGASREPVSCCDPGRDLR